MHRIMQSENVRTLAITIGDEIYFRNNRYNPDSEEGRKLLAHELTHVSQYQEGRVSRIQEKEDEDALEDEALRQEAGEVPIGTKMVTLEVGGKLFRFGMEYWKEYAAKIADAVEDRLEKERYNRSEESYLRLLCAVESWLKENI